jgi:hypothetical protein
MKKRQGALLKKRHKKAAENCRFFLKVEALLI